MTAERVRLYSRINRVLSVNTVYRISVSIRERFFTIGHFIGAVVSHSFSQVGGGEQRTRGF